MFTVNPDAIAIFVVSLANSVMAIWHSRALKKLKADVPPGTATHVYDDFMKFILPEIEKLLKHNQPPTTPVPIVGQLVGKGVTRK